MTTPAHGVRYILDQRYYHFVLFRNTRRQRLSEYWRSMGHVVAPPDPADWRGETFEIQHRKVRMDRGFARGTVGELLSQSGRGNPPFLYDVIAAQIGGRGDSYVALGFPFVEMGLELVQQLLDRTSFLRDSDFLGVDVPSLVRKGEQGFESFEEMSTRIVGVQFVVTDDKSLTAVRLGGDDPLSAEIYVQFLHKKVSEGFILPDRSVLACERSWRQPVDGPPDITSRAFRSRLHVDGRGHFKFYAQTGCRNVRLFPFAVAQLRAIGCLLKVFGNPLVRANREEAE